MSTGKYIITTNLLGEVYVGSHTSTKQEALSSFLKAYNLKPKSVKSCKISSYYKARVAYIKAIRKANYDLTKAAFIADTSGYNPACDYTDE